MALQKVLQRALNTYYTTVFRRIYNIKDDDDEGEKHEMLNCKNLCVIVFNIIPGISLAQITRHASEIVNMALDLMSISSDLEFQAGPETKLRLRMGIHTGNVPNI